ncbi:hypothetical protein LHYA1_G008590 [Lachnellula hyalina]|uniref:Uncharacterized protein n=1 Tax=Lachnellula hyalina TaxID=1316788 RepID=A0A8H8R0S2_9HELO|nr:uncharacterized protein LHYA1_G008590 [Lachnellula hyalina]TVY25305.1 hypothetical protein LHYA1_G008590 [Lachnellula hyalina]
MDNLERGLYYIPLDLYTARLFIFIDGSLANNKDLRYIIVLVNERLNKKENKFTIKGNIAY